MRVRGPQPLHHDERTDARRDFLFTWQGGRLSAHTLNSLIAALCRSAGVPRYTSHRFRHTLAVQWRRTGCASRPSARCSATRSLQMTLRYAAVMPPTMRRELDAAFAALDEEHRTTAQVRVVLSPRPTWPPAGSGANRCGSTWDRLVRPQRVPALRQPPRLPALPELHREARPAPALRGAAAQPRRAEHARRGRAPPPTAEREIAGAVAALDRRIVAMGGETGAEPVTPAGDGQSLREIQMPDLILTLDV